MCRERSQCPLWSECKQVNKACVSKKSKQVSKSCVAKDLSVRFGRVHPTWQGMCFEKIYTTKQGMCQKVSVSASKKIKQVSKACVRKIIVSVSKEFIQLGKACLERSRCPLYVRVAARGLQKRGAHAHESSTQAKKGGSKWIGFLFWSNQVSLPRVVSYFWF